MPDKIVRRSKVAEGLAVVAVFVAFTTSIAAYAANRRAIDKINDSRIQITYVNCQETNKRNIDTKKQLRALIDKAIEKTPERKVQLENSFIQTSLLINALDPIQDCKALVQKRFGRLPEGLSK